jgi:hypothetical protein
MADQDSPTAEASDPGTTPVPLASWVIAGAIDLLGDRLTCYIANASDAQTIVRWQFRGQVPYAVARRLEIALQLALLLHARRPTEEIRSWFTWLSDLLDDRSPASTLHDARTEDDFETRANLLMAAARAYLTD